MLDCVLRVQTQSHAYRFATYHASFPHLYPEGFGDEALELGPRTDKDGPCLVLFRGVRTAPADLNAWLATTCLRTSVGRVLWVGGDTAGHVQSLEELLHRVAELAASLGGPLRLQCEPRSLETLVADNLPKDIPLHPTQCTHVVHVLHWDGHYRYHAQPASLLWLNPPDKAPRVPEQLSKAAGKLAEALEVAQFTPKSGLAVDIGAAPGGWTSYLAQRVQHVVAVDPAAMDPRALAHGNVTHLQARVEDALEEIRRLAGEVGGADLVISDMNQHPTELLPLMRDMPPLLRPGGLMVLTLKFRGGGRDRSGWEQKVASELAGMGMGRVRLMHLAANTKNERTCLAFKS